MDVLSFIFTGLVMIGILGYLQWLNDYTWKRYSFRIFHKRSFWISIVGYVFVYVGNMSYMNALKSSGDLLNGGIIIFIGTCMILYVVIKNIQRSSLIIGFTLSLLQGVVYIILAYAGIFYIMILVIAAAQVRPVYVVNR